MLILFAYLVNANYRAGVRRRVGRKLIQAFGRHKSYRLDQVDRIVEQCRLTHMQRRYAYRYYCTRPDFELRFGKGSFDLPEPS